MAATLVDQKQKGKWLMADDIVPLEDICFFKIIIKYNTDHSQHTYTHPYKRTHVNPTPTSIFEDWAGKS